MQPADIDPPASRIEAGVKRIAALLERDEPAEAAAAALELRALVPGNRDVLHLLAVCQRRLRRIPEAIATLAALEERHPLYGRLYLERGHCHAALDRVDAAIEAYSQAVILNPDLREGWIALRSLFAAKGLHAEADNAARHVARIAEIPPDIVTAAEMLANGEVGVAEELVRDHLRRHGEHVESLRLLARIAMRFDAAHDAELLLERALVLAPQHRDARQEYALVLLQRQSHRKADAQLQALLTDDPRNRSDRILQAAAWAGLGDYDKALPMYRALIAESPRRPELHLSVAHALKALGRTQEAIESYRRAAALAPGLGEAYWSLANLKTYRFSDEDLAHMQAAEARGVSPENRCHFCFALGKALEDRGQYAQSFAYYERGNALKLSEVRSRPEDFERAAALQTSLCTREFFAARAGYGCDSDAPIFIVGLPRSGSTLIEQILASHAQVEGTMELADIPRLVQDLQSSELAGAESSYPGILAQLTAARCRRLGEDYLRDTRVYRSGRPFFIDKMPNNFLHLGLIHLILPNARIIDARRDPMACSFSIFKQLFAAGQRFAYSMEHIARYYRMYVDLMAHWDRVLPGKVLRVHHEDVVRDLDGQVRRLLDFCGLDFEPSCLEFHKTRRAVHSASSEQVHLPLYSEGVDQWRHFDPWLAPLKSALAPVRDGHG